jgi:hypothetical protein
VHGRLVVTDTAGAAARLRSPGSGLPATARLPDATEWWAYADVGRALPVARVFAGLFETPLQDRLEARLAPLRDVLVYSAHDGRIQTSVTRIDTA